MSRQPHGDATVGNRRQSPAPYHRKHRGSTFLQVPHAPHVYGAPRGRRGAAKEALGGTGRRLVGEAAAADGQGMAGREASDERGAARLARVEGAGKARATPKGIVPVSPAGYSEVFPVLIPCASRRELDSAEEKRI